jgi:hypothetical protein
MLQMSVEEFNAKAWEIHTCIEVPQFALTDGWSTFCQNKYIKI